MNAFAIVQALNVNLSMS